MAETVAVVGGDQVPPEEYMRYTLRLCLEKRKAQLPATHGAADYAAECDAKLADLEAAIAADDTAAVRAILDWSKATHERFAGLRAG
jgi:DNA-binding GntR family transcriptional regulator